MKISSRFFYLGLCNYDDTKVKENRIKINNNIVKIVSGGIRGLHAIALSKDGALELLQFADLLKERFMDVCLEEFSRKYPANVVRYDLESYIPGHRGIFFQDRNQFQSTIR